jgi:hypothetical protein
MNEFLRPVVHLNPKPGSPGVADSHIGGPLLWPADEPWPWCDGARHDEPGVPTPFVAALQFYRRDYAELPFPSGTDLLQVFLCPQWHSGEDCGPGVHLVWRDSAAVVELIEEIPQPSLHEEFYRFTTNVFAPVRSTELPRHHDRPESLRDENWPDPANGTKIGGWTIWCHGEPLNMECPKCGERRRQVLALGSVEPDDYEVGWEMGRYGRLNVLLCPRDVHHPMKVHND